MSDFHHTLEASLGFMFAGSVMSAVLVGFLLCQGLTYFIKYPRDRLYIKVLVAVTLLCEVVHQALISYTLYHFAVDEPVQLKQFIWGILLPCIPNSLAIAAVQAFFILRIWHFSKKARFLAGVLTFMIFLEFALAMVLVFKFLKVSTYDEFFMSRRWMMAPTSLAALIDIIIAVALVVTLHRSRTGVQRTDSMIDTIMVFSVSTGLVTAIWAVGTLVAIAITGVGLVSMFFYCLLGGIYVISLLFSLNVRQSILAAGADTTISFVGPRDRQQPHVLQLSVHVSSTVDQKIDVF